MQHTPLTATSTSRHHQLLAAKAELRLAHARQGVHPGTDGANTEVGVQEPAALAVEAAGVLRIWYQEKGTEQTKWSEGMLITVIALVSNGCKAQILVAL